MMKMLKYIHVDVFLIGISFFLFMEVLFKFKIEIIEIDIIKAITPPSLFGIDRKIV